MLAASTAAAARLRLRGTGLKTSRRRTPPIRSSASRQVRASIWGFSRERSCRPSVSTTAVSRLSSNWSNRRSSTVAMLLSVRGTNARRPIR